MSLIQEALKRQQEEMGRNTGESAERGLVPPKAPPPIPADLSDDPPPQPPESARRSAPSTAKKRSFKGVGVLLVSLVLILLMLGAAIYFFLVAAKTYHTGRQATSPSASNEGEGSAPATAVEAQGTEKAQPTPAARRSSPAEVKTEASRPAPAVKPASEPRGRVETQPLSTPPKGQWPKLTVMGVVVKSDPRMSTAVINNAMVGSYEYVEGVRVLEIRSDGVLLQYDGEKRVVSLGSSTR